MLGFFMIYEGFSESCQKMLTGKHVDVKYKKKASGLKFFQTVKGLCALSI